MADYNPAEIEPKWQRVWAEKETFKVGAPGEKKLYCLDMFPYPSGAGLHVGHPLGYIATDIFCRYKRMQGYSVLHPMGFDAFGLPAEQHAMATGEHPAVITEHNCRVFADQMKKLGLSYDWSRELATCRPDYYKWTQWIFLKLYHSWFDSEAQKARPISDLPVPDDVKGQGDRAVEEYRAKYRLAFYTEAMVNWCPALGTVLANEEVIDGKSERGGHPVVRKPMKQWMLRITEYAERLLKDLDEISWPESIKEQQRNWIGKAHGAEIAFQIDGQKGELRCFTTRPDTLFGVTFFVISPEHPAAESLTTDECREQVVQYCEKAKALSDFARTVGNREKTGVFTGSFVRNPINDERVPVYIGDYVLMSYGTGAVMGVPAHDERDFDFARLFNLPIRPVIAPEDQTEEVRRAVIEGECAWTSPGRMLPCDYEVCRKLGLPGKSSDEAKTRIVGWLEEQGKGKGVVTYKLRDWLFSRQRYWGEPIPVIHWEDEAITTVPDEDLPLTLPELKEYKPGDEGESPLARAAEWLYVTDPKTGRKGRRETNTMPQWAGSCWYYLRFIDPKNNEKPWDPDLERRWMPVDLYVGGAEHAVLHLLYARFWHKVLYDLGHVSTNEPFQRLVNQGMMQAFAYKDSRGALVPTDEVQEDESGTPRRKETGETLERIIAKMSKSLRNVVNPDSVVAEYGADTLRTYIMFMGPLESSRMWDSKAILGNFRFLRKAWTLVTDNQDSGVRATVSDSEEPNEVKSALHRAIKRVTEDLEGFQFNTAISALMEFSNQVAGKPVSAGTLKAFTLLLAPLAPHIGEELWARLGEKECIAHAPWPQVDERYLVTESVPLVIQVNGKKRGLEDVSVSASEDDVREMVAGVLRGTPYEIADEDKFIFVRNPETKHFKLVNVLQKR